MDQNKKPYIVRTLALSLLGIAVLAGGYFAVTHAGQQPSGNSGPAVTTISDETTSATDELLPIAYAEGEEVENLFYRSSRSDSGALAYELNAKEQGSLIIPVSETVIYTAAEDEVPSMEKVLFSYTMSDGTTKDVTQYRITLPSTAVAAAVENTTEDKEASLKTGQQMADAPVDMTINGQPADALTGEVVQE